MADSKIMIDNIGERTVRIEGTASTVAAFSDENPVGATLWRSLEELDVEVLPLPEGVATYWGIELHGNPTTVRERLPQLETKLDDIAATADPDQTVRWGGAASLIRGGLNCLQTTYSDASFMLQMGILAAGPAGHYVSANGELIPFYGRTGKDYRTNKAAKHPDGSRMGALCARDLGGLVIDWSGRPVSSPFKRPEPPVRLDLQTAAALERYAKQHDKKIGWAAGLAVKQFVDSPDPAKAWSFVDFDRREPNFSVKLDIDHMTLERFAHMKVDDEDAGLEDILRGAISKLVEDQIQTT